ncbi:putative bifunctional diguanylate cyclase/phosphodiesterase [Clostridium sp. JNZ X4-2]
MLNRQKNYPIFVPDILNKMRKAEDMDELLKYENILIATFISSIGGVGSAVNFIIACIRHNNFIYTFIIPIFIMIGSVILYCIPKKHLSERVKVHIINAICIFLICALILPYYSQINVLSWFIIFIIILIALIRTEPNMLYHVIAVSVGMYFFTVYMSYNINAGYYNVIEFILLMVVLAISFAVNKLHENLTKSKFRQIYKITEQNQKISMLYEEILASAEELKQQNNELEKCNEQIRKDSEHLNYIANYDSLTGLPNRKMFMDKLELDCKLGKRDEAEFAVVFIDLDNFKKINDTMGHYVGDKYLCKVSKRLIKLIEKNDIMGRLGGDEFGLVVHEYHNKESLMKYIKGLKRNFENHFLVGKYELHSSASFGISIYPHDGENAIDLIKAADTALYKVKESGKNDIRFFNNGMKREIIFNTYMENSLFGALYRNELYLVYQPEFQTDYNSSLNGFEALLRWKTRENRVIGPTSFISVAEKTGIINEIGEWVIRQACKKINKLKCNYNRNFFISVNVSPVQMKNKRFVEKVKCIIEEEKVDPHLLELEITESVFIGNMNQAVSMIKQLKKMGLRIALDDFGTGYSSLNYLRQLPIDTLKIDKSFIDALDKDECKKEKTIVNSIISLMHEMKISVVSEGVETSRQLRYLKQADCDKVQGFLLARPLTEGSLDDLLKSIYS